MGGNSLCSSCLIDVFRVSGAQLHVGQLALLGLMSTDVTPHGDGIFFNGKVLFMAGDCVQVRAHQLSQLRRRS